MRRAKVLGLATWMASASTAVGTAHAEPPNAKATPVYVLRILTDDSDDQADSLTTALRSRARQAHGWSLADTSQSLETLAIALKCPSKPDPACLDRIGDQLRADHYLWGTLGRKKPGEVTADIHLWNRGKAERETTETYSESLKDANDDRLRAIAGRLFEGVTGPAGDATGASRVAVETPGEQARFTGGADRSVTLAPRGSRETHVVEPRETSFPLHDVLGYSAIAVGLGFVTGATIEGLNWLADNNASNNDRKGVPSSITDVCAHPTMEIEVDACNKNRDATSRQVLGWTFLGVSAALIGTGAWLIATDRGLSTARAEAGHAGTGRGTRFAVFPTFGAHEGALRIEGVF